MPTTCKHCSAELPDNAKYCCVCGRKQVSAPRRHRRTKRPQAQGSITPLRGRRKGYWARLPATYESGKPVRRSLGCFATYADAAEAIARALYLDAKAHDTDNYTLRDIYARFVASNHFDNLTSSTQDSHRNSWRQLSAIADMRVADITTASFQQVVDDVRVGGAKRGTLAKLRNTASRLCQEAMAMGLMAVNYGKLIQLPRDDSEAVLPFLESELKLLWNAADDGNTDAMVVLVMCYTGMRPGELLGAEIDKHLHSHGEYRFFRAGSKTRAGRNRLIPIPSIVAPLVDILIAGRTSGPLVATATGKHYRLDNWRHRCFIPLMRELGIVGHTPYSCRHTYADMLKRKQVSGDIAKAIFGHESYTTTETYYQQTTEDDIARICSAVDDITRPK